MIGVFTGRSYGQRVENVTFIRIETELVENLHLFQPSDWMVLTCLTMHKTPLYGHCGQPEGTCS